MCATDVPQGNFGQALVLGGLDGMRNKSAVGEKQKVNTHVATEGAQAGDKLQKVPALGKELGLPPDFLPRRGR